MFDPFTRVAVAFICLFVLVPALSSPQASQHLASIAAYWPLIAFLAFVWVARRPLLALVRWFLEGFFGGLGLRASGLFRRPRRSRIIRRASDRDDDDRDPPRRPKDKPARAPRPSIPSPGDEAPSLSGSRGLGATSGALRAAPVPLETPDCLAQRAYLASGPRPYPLTRDASLPASTDLSARLAASDAVGAP